VPEDAALRHRRHVALEDVQVRPAERRRVHLDDHVGRVLDARVVDTAALPRRCIALVSGRPARASFSRMSTSRPSTTWREETLRRSAELEEQVKWLTCHPNVSPGD